MADSGFRPQSNGFSFENYGNDASPVNLTAHNVEDLFGPQVCASGEGPTCKLIPQARFWMDRVNASMANGHCMGFSVTALRFFSGNLGVSTFGGTSTISLPVRNNGGLQSLIAEDFAYQDLPSVTDRAVQGTPNQVLAALTQALRTNREQYTLGILKADGTGGHAITPFAVEDRGGGRAEILVYDNNFPGVARKVDVNTNADTWHYVGGINPADTSEIYQGDARTRSMLLLPTSPGEGQQPCPFCAAGANPGRPSVIDKLHYIEVASTTKGPEHPHLLLIDPQGRRTGFLNGRLINEIPGIQVVQNYGVQNWNATSEPVYDLPLGHPDYRVILDGSSVKHPVVTQLQVNGAGIVFYVKDIHVYPGQQDAFVLPAGDLAFAYVPGGRFPATPTIAAQFLQFVPGSTRGRLITIATGSLGFAPGSQITLAVRPSTGTAEVSGAGDKPLISGVARFALAVDSSPVGGGLPERLYRTARLPLNGSTAQLAQFQYLTPTTAQLPVRILGPAGVRRFSVPGQKG